MSSLVVLADVHLGRKQSGDKKTGPGIEWALETLELAAAAGASHLVVVGDIIDRKSYTEATYRDVTGFFSRGLELFEKVVFIAGNHDVHHDLGGVIPREVIVAGTQPHTIEVGEWALHTAAVEVDRDPRSVVRDFPHSLPHAVNLGLLHTSVTGDHSKNDCLPCTTEELLACGYDAWILGHVHSQLTLCSKPFIGWVGMERAYLVDTKNGHTRVRNLVG